MAHEMTQTVRKQDGMYYIINGYDGTELMGPFATQQEADMRARMRSEMQGEMRQGRPEGAGPLGLGELSHQMNEGYAPRNYGSSPDSDVEPEPSQYPDLEYDETGEPFIRRARSVYTAQTPPIEPPRPPQGPVMLPPNRPMRPGLGQLAQGPALDPRMQKMMEDAERGRRPGPAGQYFKGQPQQPAPLPPQPAAPGSNLPGGGPRPGETEDQYLQRIIRGG